MNMKYLKILILFYFTFFTYSCGAVKESFTNQKKNSSDEFLVEKKSPLVMPPNFNELPTPTSENQNELSGNKIKDLVSNEDNEIKESEGNNKNFEDSLLEKIKNN